MSTANAERKQPTGAGCSDLILSSKPLLVLAQLEKSLNSAQRVLAVINSNLVLTGAKPLYDYIQGNSFSGLVSNILCDALNEHSPYKHNSHQAYPDLINPE